MPWGQRESRQWPWIIFLHFLDVLTCLFAGFVFTDLCLVWDPFLEVTPKWGPQLSVFTFSWLVFNSLPLPLRHRLKTDFPARVSLYFHLVAKGGTYLHPMFPHQHRRYVNPIFFKSFLINVVIHPWLVDLNKCFSLTLRLPSFCLFFI